MTLRDAALVMTALLILSAALPAAGRKVTTTRPVTAAKAAKIAKAAANEAPAVTVDTIAAGDSTLRLAGYDKPLRSRHESLLITSLVDDTVVGATFTITYLDLQGRTLHERDVTVNALVPPGETRLVDFPSWDRQQAFYYHRGPKPRSAAVTPYDVSIRMRALLKPRSIDPDTLSTQP